MLISFIFLILNMFLAQALTSIKYYVQIYIGAVTNVDILPGSLTLFPAGKKKFGIRRGGAPEAPPCDLGSWTT